MMPVWSNITRLSIDRSKGGANPGAMHKANEKEYDGIVMIDVPRPTEFESVDLVKLQSIAASAGLQRNYSDRSLSDTASKADTAEASSRGSSSLPGLTLPSGLNDLLCITGRSPAASVTRTNFALCYSPGGASNRRVLEALLPNPTTPRLHASSILKGSRLLNKGSSLFLPEPTLMSLNNSTTENGDATSGTEKVLRGRHMFRDLSVDDVSKHDAELRTAVLRRVLRASAGVCGCVFTHVLVNEYVYVCIYIYIYIYICMYVCIKMIEN